MNLPSASIPLTVYFDGACPVCSAEIAQYRRQPGAQVRRWVDAAACAEDELGPGLAHENAPGRFHVRTPDGRILDGTRAFAILWRKPARVRGGSDA